MTQVTISAFEMFALFEMTPDLVCIAGKDGYLKKVNPAVVAKLGYSEDELYENPIAFFIYPEDWELTHRERVKLLNGKPLINFQNRWLTKDGRIVWLEWTSIYSSDKEIVFAIAKDITARKAIEKDIADKYSQFRSLATHFKAIIEKERKYLAVELHEELAQLASVVKLDVDWVNTNETCLSGLAKLRMEHAVAVTDLLLTTIRRISFSISPNMLEDLGLAETLRWHCNEFAIVTGIPCHFEAAFTEADLNTEMQLDFFRICQEALNNIMDHAQASEANIQLTQDANTVTLLIRDNGVGFETVPQKQTPGLDTIRSLSASINAALDIQSNPGSGTTIKITVAKQLVQA
jgi:PAS domain S-box-containing protein